MLVCRYMLYVRRCALVNGDFIKMPGASSSGKDGSLLKFKAVQDNRGAEILFDRAAEAGVHFASPRPTPPPSREASMPHATAATPRRRPNVSEAKTLAEACASGDLQNEAGREIQKEVSLAGSDIMASQGRA
jgi:hypothetical protein